MKQYLTFIFTQLIAFAAFAQSLDDAKRLTENEQYEAATEIYKTQIVREPANGNNFYFFGENLLLSDLTDSARIVFEQGRKVDPKNALLKIGLAKILLNSTNVMQAKVFSEKDPANTVAKSHYEEAKANVDRAMVLIDEAATPPPSPGTTILIEAADALIHFKNKNTDRAKQLLDKAFAMDQKNADIQILYGDIYTELNNGTLAADYYNKALELNKGSARAIVNKGRLYKRSTNYEGAAEEFANAIKIDSSYAPAYRELGETFFKQGKLEKAKENYRKYLELSKNNCGARIRYASFLYLGKDYTGAVNELKQVQLKCDPNDFTSLRVFSYCYYELKDYSQGLETINRLFLRLPEEKRTAVDYEYFGKLLNANNQDSLGNLQLWKSYNLEPERTDLLSEIAKSYYKQKNYAAAIEAFNQKINTGKDVKVGDYIYLGRSSFFNSEFLEADSAFAKVTELNPGFDGGWLWRAKANSHIDSTSELGLAKPYYEKFIELSREDSANISKYQNGLVEAYGYLAYFFILKKDNANALMYLKKKVELPLEPEDKKNVEQAIDQLEGKKTNK